MSRMPRRLSPPRGGGGGGIQLDSHREKAMRSIFVANISFETTEEEMRAVLSEVGPVVSLKLIQDPVSGKPRGFGFCEYEDAETALSACRNLAGREVNGRGLRIDSAMNAPGEGFRPPVGVPQGPVEPPLHGPPIAPENAPEAITKAVASLPPEHMYELMKQIKWCIQNNHQETRQLLIHNPQLAYAILQAQVVMRIVDLETAQNLLHRAPRGPPLPPPSGPPPHHGNQPPHHGNQPPPHHSNQPPPHHGNQPPPHHSNQPPPPHHHSNQPPPHHNEHPIGRHGNHPPSDHPMGRHPPPRHGNPHHHDDRFNRPPPPGREWYPPNGPPPPPPSRPPPHPTVNDNDDQEKAALLMQVLSLTDEQIQMLPPDQRNNIMRLKEQLSHTT